MRTCAWRGTHSRPSRFAQKFSACCWTKSRFWKPCRRYASSHARVSMTRASGRSLTTLCARWHQLDFLDFRDYLFPASGFQSKQFRLLEVGGPTVPR